MAEIHVSRRNGNRQAFFRSLLERYHRRDLLSSDPVLFVHRYSDPRDREVVGFLATCFSYGSVVLIQRALEAVLAPMGPSPFEFVAGFDGRSRWPGFYHRFHHEQHLVILIELLRDAIAEFGSLEVLFRRAFEDEGDEEEAPAERVLNGATAWLHARSRELIDGRTGERLAQGMRFLFNSPSTGSACKRMLMFLRWMVRDDEIDFGLWKWFSPADLVIPVDTHVARLSYYLGLRSGEENRATNWKMAMEITDSLRQLNPRDPVCYDFALTRLGILEICKRAYEPTICDGCPVRPLCRIANPGS